MYCSQMNLIIVVVYWVYIQIIFHYPFSVPKKVFDPSGRNIYHKLCKEEGMKNKHFVIVNFNLNKLIDLAVFCHEDQCGFSTCYTGVSISLCLYVKRIDLN